MQEVLTAVLAEIPVEFGRSATEIIATVSAERLYEAAFRLKHDDRTRMNYLRCLSAVDYVERVEVVYHLLSLETRDRFTLKVALPPEGASVASVTPIWKGADWHEREAAELFGITFPGHPHMVFPFLLEEGFVGHPLRKSYPLPELPPTIPGVANRPRDLWESEDSPAAGAEEPE
jgi:NADH-quinone oxidoreductase subunit C